MGLKMALATRIEKTKNELKQRTVHVGRIRQGERGKIEIIWARSEKTKQLRWEENDGNLATK